MEKTFEDVKVGDVIVCHDNNATYYEEHLFKVQSIECDPENITKTNPTGRILYGEDLDYADDEDEYIGCVNEFGFVGVLEDYNTELEIPKEYSHEFVSWLPDELSEEIMRRVKNAICDMGSLLTDEERKEAIERAYCCAKVCDLNETIKIKFV